MGIRGCAEVLDEAADKDELAAATTKNGFRARNRFLAYAAARRADATRLRSVVEVKDAQ